MHITGTECCERLAYYGIATNLVTYLTKKLHEGNVSAARNVTTWQGTCYLTPLIGAIMADAYWGRYWTIGVFSTIYFIVSPIGHTIHYSFCASKNFIEHPLALGISKFICSCSLCYFFVLPSCCFINCFLHYESLIGEDVGQLVLFPQVSPIGTSFFILFVPVKISFSIL